MHLPLKLLLPGSQVDLRPVRNLDKLLGEDFDFKVLKFNQKRGNIVLSRRVLLEIDRDEKRLKTLEILQEGALINGYIKNITDYGVFVDLGGVDGLLHITDMTWGRIVHPSEMFEIGDEVEVVVLKYFPEDQKVSLGLKQKAQNPWEMVEEKFAVGTKVSGKIVSLTDYGAYLFDFSQEQQDALASYAIELGYSFQLSDDYLDMFGSKKIPGEAGSLIRFCFAFV